MRRVKSLKRLLKKETSSPPKSQKSSSSVISNITIIATAPSYKIEQIKMARKFGMVLKKLGILDRPTDETVRNLYGKSVFPGHEWHEEFKSRFPMGFGLKECKDYVERLYTNGVLPKGSNEH